MVVLTLSLPLLLTREQCTCYSVCSFFWLTSHDTEIRAGGIKREKLDMRSVHLMIWWGEPTCFPKQQEIRRCSGFSLVTLADGKKSFKFWLRTKDERGFFCFSDERQ